MQRGDNVWGGGRVCRPGRAQGRLWMEEHAAKGLESPNAKQQGQMWLKDLLWWNVEESLRYPRLFLASTVIPCGV